MLPVVEEQFLAWVDEAFSNDTDAMIAIDHHDFGVTVGINRMICKTYLISLASGIHDEIFGENLNSIQLSKTYEGKTSSPLFKLNKNEHMYLS